MPFDNTELLRNTIGNDRARFMTRTAPDMVTDAMKLLLRPAAMVAAKNGGYRFEGNFASYTAQVKYHGVKFHLEDEQDTALELGAMAPHGLQLRHALADRALINFGLGLPAGYSWFPYKGQFYNKAVLRLAFADSLPPAIVRRNFRSRSGGIAEVYCYANRHFLGNLLNTESWLAQLQIIDPVQVKAALAKPKGVLRTSIPLVAMAMVELWLQALAQ